MSLADPPQKRPASAQMQAELQRVVERLYPGWRFIPNSEVRLVLLELGDRLAVDPVALQEVGLDTGLIRNGPFPDPDADCWERLPPHEREQYRLPRELPGLTSEQLRNAASIRSVSQRDGRCRYHVADVERVLQARRERLAKQENRLRAQGQTMIVERGQVRWIF